MRKGWKMFGLGRSGLKYHYLPFGHAKSLCGLWFYLKEREQLNREPPRRDRCTRCRLALGEP